MDIKSKNRMSIGNRILASYFILICITFLIIGVSFSQISKSYVIDKTQKEIEQQAQRIVKIITPNFDKLSAVKENQAISGEIVKQMELRITGISIDSQVYIINNRGRVIFKRGTLNNQKLIDYINDRSLVPKGVVICVEPVSIKGSEKGNVVVLAKLEDLKSINETARSFMMIAMGISAVFAVIISFLMQRNIVNPIKNLREKVDLYKNTEDLDEGEGAKFRDELADLSMSFDMMIQRIDKYTSNQKLFFQNASHELKTPLMSIQGYAEGIREGVITGEDIDTSLNIIESESQRLKKIVEEMILITKLDDANEKFNFATCSIVDILNESLNAINPLLDSNLITINFNYTEDVLGEFDYEKLKRAFINIIGNCARYAKSSIDIGFVNKNGYVYLDIKDDGQGFEPGEEELIFQRFYKGENGGSGIGLSLTKAIIEKHGGDIKAVNNINMGALFKLVLPIKQK